MKNMLYALAILLVLFSTNSVLAQQDAQFTQYMFNSMFFNPASVGMDGGARFQLMHRSQWLGYSGIDQGGAPTTQMLSFNAPLMQASSGIGVHIVNDKLGPLNNLEAQLSYSYHLPLANGKLGFGIRVGAYGKTIDWDMYRAADPNDAIIKTGKESAYRPDFAFGVWYKKERFYLGASVNHLIKTKFDFGLDSLRNVLSRHGYFTGGYNYEVNYNFILTPSVIVKSDFNTLSYELSLLGTYNNKFWGGLSYRDSDAISAILGFSMLKDNSLRLGYAFDYVLANSAKAPTSHELLLSYTLPIELKGSKPIIRTPRYRK